MAKLPTRESLGPPPSARSGRAIARAQASVPDVSAIGRGVADLGRGIASIGDAAAAFHERDLRRQQFDVERRFQEFAWEQRKGLDTSMRSIQPGQATGFAERWGQDYVAGGKEFFATIPNEFKAEYEQKLFRVERELYGAANTFAQDEQKRFATNSVIDLTENIYRPRARMVPTESMDAVTADFERLVRASPDLTPIEKEELIRKGLKAIGQSHIDALPPEEVKKLLEGGSGSVVDAIITAESGGNVGAKNPKSSAAGLGQFIDSTWLDMVKRNRPDIAQGRSDDEILALRTDPAFADLSRGMVASYARENAATLEAADIPALPSNIYLAHFLGPQGAIEVLSAPPDTPIADILPAKVVSANKEALAGKTAGEVSRWAAGKMGGARPASFDSFTDEDRANAVEGADREIAARDRALDRAEGDVRSAIAKTGHDMMLDDTLTVEWLASNRDILSVSDYKTFLRSLQPDADTRKTDPRDYLRLYDLAEQDPEAAKAEVRDMYANGQLAKDDFKSLFNRATTSQDQQRGRTYTDEIRGYVKKQLQPDSMAPDSHYARQLDALFAFDDWLENNKDVRREDIRKEADTIIADFKKIRYASGVTELPLPRFVTKSREAIDEADLEQAKQQLITAMRNRSINEHDAAGQAALLRRWFAIVRDKD